MRGWVAKLEAGGSWERISVMQVRDDDDLDPDGRDKGSEKWSDSSGYTLKLDSTEFLNDQIWVVKKEVKCDPKAFDLIVHFLPSATSWHQAYPLPWKLIELGGGAARALTEHYPKSVSMTLIQYPSILHKRMQMSFEMKYNNQNGCKSLRNFKALWVFQKLWLG